MPVVPDRTETLLELCRKSGVVEPADLKRFLARHPLPAEPKQAAEVLIKKGLLTRFQAVQLLAGRHRGFLIGSMRVLDKLGTGGMGTVFLCEHVTLRRKVAVKVLPEEHARDPGSRERFYREARAAALLDHPNVVRVHDINSQGEMHYLVMDYVEGIDLQQMTKVSGALPYAQAVGYVCQAAAGLQHAHEKGLVHRDIKPANLLVGKDGVLRILDMGLARFFLDPTDDLTQRFDDGTILGTVDYLAPEQAIKSSSVDHRADIYSLGATLYTLIAGRTPFEGNPTQKLLMVQMRIPPALHQHKPDVPPALSAVVARMMAKDPAERCQSAAEVLEALYPWCPSLPTAPGSSMFIQKPLDGATLGGVEQSTARLAPTMKLEPATTSARSVKSKPAAPAPRASRKRLFVAGGAVGVLLVGLVIALSGRSSDPKEQPTPGPGQPVAHVNPPPAPAAPAWKPGPAPKNAALHLDLSGEPFSKVRARGWNTVHAEGALPRGWSVLASKDDTTVEASVEPAEGAMAFALRSLEGPNAAMLFSPKLTLTAGHRYEITVDHLSQDARGGLAFWTEARKSRVIANLNPTGGKWQQTTVTLDAPPNDGARFEVHNWTAGAANPIRVRALTVRDVGSVEADGRMVLYHLDLSKETPFSLRMEQYKFEEKVGKFPDGWSGNSWKPGGRVEFVLEQANGSWAWALRNVKEAALQVMSQKPFENARPGGRYVVKLTYAADENARGELQVRDNRDEFKHRAGLHLYKTDGRWRTVEVLACPTDGMKLSLFIQNMDVRSRNTIYVKAIEVYELPALAGDTVLKRLDVGDKPVSVWVKQRQEAHRMGDGELPPGWRAAGALPDTVTELAVERFAGVNAVALRNNDGPAGAQLVADGAVPVKGGKAYLVRAVYQAQSKTRLAMTIRNEARGWEVGRLPMNPTFNEWRETGLIYRPAQDGTLALTFQSGVAGADTDVHFRTVEIVEMN